MLEIAGIAGLLSTALGIGEQARRKILGSRLEHSLEVQHSVQAWRVLRSPSDFSEALDRAIASDRESIRLYERRAISTKPFNPIAANGKERTGRPKQPGATIFTPTDLPPSSVLSPTFPVGLRARRGPSTCCASLLHLMSAFYMVTRLGPQLLKGDIAPNSAVSKPARV